MGAECLLQLVKNLGYRLIQHRSMPQRAIRHVGPEPERDSALVICKMSTDWKATFTHMRHTGIARTATELHLSLPAREVRVLYVFDNSHSSFTSSKPCFEKA